MKCYSPELKKNFNSRDEMLFAIKTDIKKVIAYKKSIDNGIKKADCYNIIAITGDNSSLKNQLASIMIKAANPFTKAADVMKGIDLPNLVVTSIANTTNWFDSHRDVHGDGIWNKTLADNAQKGFKHLQEHKDGFEYVISTGALVTIDNTTFKALGFPYEGTTQALKGVSVVDPNRNLFMYNQYANKWVTNHSVGMIYKNIIYCADSNMEGMEQEKANFDKYYPVIANKSDVDQYGYFFYVTEAQLCEYSAVVDGSNIITPTESVEIEAAKTLADEQAAEALRKSLETTKRRVII